MINIYKITKQKKKPIFPSGFRKRIYIKAEIIYIKLSWSFVTCTENRCDPRWERITPMQIKNQPKNLKPSNTPQSNIQKHTIPRPQKHPRPRAQRTPQSKYSKTPQTKSSETPQASSSPGLPQSRSQLPALSPLLPITPPASSANFRSPHFAPPVYKYIKWAPQF